jgi:hypothetical protein
VLIEAFEIVDGQVDVVIVYIVPRVCGDAVELSGDSFNSHCCNLSFSFFLILLYHKLRRLSIANRKFLENNFTNFLAVDVARGEGAISDVSNGHCLYLLYLSF